MSNYNIFNNVLSITTNSNTGSGAVSSVAGKTGAVTLISNDITDFQPQVSANTDVVSNKNKTQILDIQGRLINNLLLDNDNLYDIGDTGNRIRSIYAIGQIIATVFKGVAYSHPVTNTGKF